MESLDVDDITQVYNDEYVRITSYLKDEETFEQSPLDNVYMVENVLPHNVCDWLINRAEYKASSMGGWTTQRHGRYPTTDIPISSLETERACIYGIIYQSLFPLIANKFEITQFFLEIKDVFIVKYNMDGQTSLDKHKDGSLFSFAILLNDASDFEGGGTKFTDDDKIYKCNKGDALLHSGKKEHAGIAITEGVRYILVGFIDYAPQETCNCEKCKAKKQDNWENMSKEEAVKCNCPQCRKADAAALVVKNSNTQQTVPRIPATTPTTTPTAIPITTPYYVYDVTTVHWALLTATFRFSFIVGCYYRT